MGKIAKIYYHIFDIIIKVIFVTENMYFNRSYTICFSLNLYRCIETTPYWEMNKLFLNIQTLIYE